MELYAVIEMSNIKAELDSIIKRIKGYAKHTKKNHRMYNKKISKRKLGKRLRVMAKQNMTIRSE